jgi:hypothetical protein
MSWFYGRDFSQEMQQINNNPNLLSAEKYRAKIDILREALDWRSNEFQKFSNEMDTEAIIMLNQHIVTIAHEVIREDDKLARELRKLADIFEGKKNDN